MGVLVAERRGEDLLSRLRRMAADVGPDLLRLRELRAHSRQLHLDPRHLVHPSERRRHGRLPARTGEALAGLAFTDQRGGGRMTRRRIVVFALAVSGATAAAVGLATFTSASKPGAFARLSKSGRVVALRPDALTRRVRRRQAAPPAR